MIDILRAEEKDAPILAALEKALFPDPYGVSGLAESLRAPYTEALLALSDGVPVGYLITALIPPEGELLRIGVLPSHRRRGIARALLGLHLASLPQGTALYLEVRESNTGAAALYTSVGFQKVGVRKNYYKSPTENAILMRRPPEEETSHEHTCL